MASPSSTRKLTSCYKASKQDVINLIRRISGTKQFLLQETETVWKALRLFETGQADFADYLVERVANAAGCRTTFTFDKTASKAGMTLLK